MLSFLTLFLGLVTGVQPVELVGPAETVRVELFLDGRPVAAVDSEPWRAEVDFGPLRPHRLEAAAYDAAGAELGRAVQWINLPRSRAEARLALDGGGGVRLVWESLENKRPTAVEVSFDDRPLAPLEGDTFRLPDYDPLVLHFLTAELSFEGNVRTRVEAAVGGQFGDRATVEMTAVPLVAERPEELGVDELAGGLRTATGAVPVVAVERGGFELVVVMEPSAPIGLGGLGRLIDSGAGAAGRGEFVMPDGASVRFLSPQPRLIAKRAIPVDLFPVSRPFTGADGELPYLVTHVNMGEPHTTPHVADAVAVAALQAAAGNRPRAVLLILGTEEADASRYGVDEVLAYLGELRVPLEVWSTGPATVRTISEGRRPVTVKSAWGRARDVSSVARLAEAATRLRRLLDGQLVAWVEGSHLPREVLAEELRGVEIAGQGG